MEKKRRGGGPIAAVTVGAALLMLLNLGPGKGFGSSGTGEPDVGTATVQTTQETPTTQPQTEPETTEAPAKRVVLVTISENDYLCDNHRYTLEELLDYLSGIGEAFLVEIREDNASLRASRDLIESLAAEGILYAEK